MVNFQNDDRDESTALVVGAGHGIGLGFVRHLLSNTELSRIYATYVP
jgi:NAD(P)-dependent dehydrogenase (short-subunit alcohol dehydrogenase family)